MNPNYHHYHTPPPRVSSRVRCPVCHEEVYSRAGIHPQCAVRQSEPPRSKTERPKPALDVEPVAAATEAAGADIILELPPAIAIFDPDRSSA
jgi:hypothetical protein